MKKTKVLIALAIVFMSVAVYASIQAGLLEFIVTDENGQPLEGVKITLTNEKGTSFHKELITNKKGKAKITLAFSIYKAVFEKKGYMQNVKQVKPFVGGRKKEKIKMLSIKEAMSEGKVEMTDEGKAVEAYNAAIELVKAGDNDGALPLLEKAVSLKPDIAPAQFNLGRLYLIKGELDKAEKALLKALELNPDINPAYAMLADVYRQKGDKKNQEKYMKIAEEKGAISGATYYNQAVEAINAGDMAKAKPLLEKCIEVDNEFADAYYQLGIIYINEGNNDKCVEFLKKYLELDPNGSNADAAKAIVQSFGG